MKRECLLRIGVAIAILAILASTQTSIVFAAPVYIYSSGDFPAYPYNTVDYMQSGRFVGCGPTTGAMIFAYFQHVFGLTGLLTSP